MGPADGIALLNLSPMHHAVLILIIIDEAEGVFVLKDIEFVAMHAGETSSANRTDAA